MNTISIQEAKKYVIKTIKFGNSARISEVCKRYFKLLKQDTKTAETDRLVQLTNKVFNDTR